MDVSNRTTTGRGVSLPDEMVAAVDKRIAGLKPWVSGFSAYVQRLIYLDLERRVINDDGGVNENAVKPTKGKSKRPFEQRPGTSESGIGTPPVYRLQQSAV